MPVAVPLNPTASTPVAEGANIWVAAGEGDDVRVQRLLDTQSLTATSADSNTYTPLHAAASYGHISTLRLLLAHSGAPENAVNVTDEDGDTPLFTVEDVAVARVLVELGADAKWKNKAGESAAETAEENGHEEVALYLRSITGEQPLYERLAGTTLREIPAADDDEDEDTSSSAPLSAEGQAAVDERADALMARVEAILSKAAQRGADGADDLTPEEEAELREVVGQEVLNQIREGWIGKVDDDEEEAKPVTAAAAEETSKAAEEGKEEEEEVDMGARSSATASEQ